MDVGSGRISVLQVAREPDVAPVTRAYAAYPVSTVLAFAQFTGQPRPACAPRPILSSHWYLGFLASRQAAASLMPQATDSTQVSDGQGARLPASGPADVPRLPASGPADVPRLPASGPADVPRLPASGPADVPRPLDARPGRRTSSPGRADLGGARGVLVRGGWAGSWQRIDGVSRLLPYSDLLALTSSSRRGEGVSDRGSWKRWRILPTGHVDAHVEPDIETGAVLIGPAWCLDR
jgi:hypothetical protein